MMQSENIKAYLKKLASSGGKKRWQGISKEKRSEIMRKVALQRWHNEKWRLV